MHRGAELAARVDSRIGPPLRRAPFKVAEGSAFDTLDET